MKQYFKAIYFSDYPAEETSGKSVTIAFSEPEGRYYETIKHFSNEEIRELIGMNSYQQLSQVAEVEERSVNQVIKRLIKKNLKEHSENYSSKDVTFVNSKAVPLQRWYPYIEGYSPEFVKQLIAQYAPQAKCLYDPFAGTGTTVFSADLLNISTVYSEVNPLLQFLVQTKINILQKTTKERKELAVKMKAIKKTIFKDLRKTKESLTLKRDFEQVFGKSKYFEEDVFKEVLKLRTYVDELVREDAMLGDLVSIAVLSSLIPVSLLKKAGDVRFKTAKELLKEQHQLKDVLSEKLQIIIEDLENTTVMLQKEHQLILSNAKNIDLIKNTKIDTVITSPPYLNGTNYFRNTKLELWFLRFIRKKEELRKFRDLALTSGINDVARKKKDEKVVEVESPLFEKTQVELIEKAYDKRIPVMAHHYFAEMQEIFGKLRKHLSKEANVLIDIGDSVFAGVHIQTDDILIEILDNLNYHFVEKKLLRKRRSRNKMVLSQTLLVFEYNSKEKQKSKKVKKSINWKKNWKIFKEELPYQQQPFAKRNWGNQRHSLCSYQGKLKPAIAHHLVNTFVPEGGAVLDPFSGVGTVPFEAALNGRHSYGFDISIPAYVISAAKVGISTKTACDEYIKALAQFIKKNKCTKAELEETKHFGYNKKIIDYYESKTLKEILLARRFMKLHFPKGPSQLLVMAALLHILHGNRPYALSRRSHPIVPYAPTGEFEYKSIIEKLKEKVYRTLEAPLTDEFTEGKIFLQDITEQWPMEIDNLDAIITSPPFFDSTRFYVANWIRIWFAGWSEEDFNAKINSFIEEKQKKSFSVYEDIFRQGRERLSRGGVFVLHLGKSYKCDMAAELMKVSKRWFKKADLFDESVAHVESHGIRDKGTVSSHQYLVLQ